MYSALCRALRSAIVRSDTVSHSYIHSTKKRKYPMAKKSKSLKALNSQVYTSFLLNGISFVVRSFVGVRPSGGEFPNREFPRSGIDGNSSGIPFSKMAFSGNSSEFPYRGGILDLQGDFYLQGGIILFTGRCLFIAPLRYPYLRLQNQKRTGAQSGPSRSV